MRLGNWIVALLALTQTAFAATLRVDKTEPIPLGVYGTIQDAVDASAPGDTISIADGRYDELNRYVYPGTGNVRYIVIVVEQGPLTFIGDSRDEVRIGPSYYIGPIADGYALCATNLLDAVLVTFRDMTFENVFQMMSVNRSLRMNNCTVQNVNHGMTITGADSVLIDQTRFENISSNTAVFGSYSPTFRTQLLRVTDSVFVNCGQGVSVLGFNEVQIDRCRFESCSTATQFDDLTVATITNSWFQRCASSVTNFDGSICHFEWNVSLGSLSQGLLSENGHFTGSHNYIEGGIGAAIQIRGNGTASFQNNTLLNGGGWTVHIGARKEYFAEPVPRFDFTDNYWGSTDSTQISAWILDEVENPLLIGVDFAPFLDESPVATEQRSLGQLKALFSGPPKH